ncbi:MAG: hypothetical protein Q9163_003558 [Psora crenata]
MPSWRDDFLSALRQRDKVEKASETAYISCTAAPDPFPHPTYTFPAGGFPKVTSKMTRLQTRRQDRFHPSQRSTDPKASRGSQNPPQSLVVNESISKLRQELAEAQSSRGFLETKLRTITETLQKLQIKSDTAQTRIEELRKDKATLLRALGDRDEEIRGKAKLLEDVHDETVSLTLQLNMADERAQELERENRELVERWMKRMGKEADDMNENSKFS